MYQNVCQKCGSLSLFTKVVGNNIGLYCEDCGKWIKWLGKDELNAFLHSQDKQKETPNVNELAIKSVLDLMSHDLDKDMKDSNIKSIDTYYEIRDNYIPYLYKKFKIGEMPC